MMNFFKLNIFSTPKCHIQIVKDTKDYKNKGLKNGLNFIFQMRNKTKLCDSQTRTWNVQDKCENKSLLC
jgi:hypothetical protein